MAANTAVVTLTKLIETKFEALDRQYPCQFADMACSVVLPKFRPGNSKDSHGLLGAPSIETWGRHQDLQWGLAKDRRAAIQCIGLKLPEGFRFKEEDDLYSKFDLWIVRLTGWLSTLSGGPTHLILQQENIIHWPEHDGELIMRTRDFAVPEPVTFAQWSLAAMQANRGQEPPLARLFLVSAMEAAAIGNWRMAVVDAATAAEVALEVGISHFIAKNALPVGAVRALKKKAKNLGAMQTLANDLGVDFPSRLEINIIAPRNIMLHSGKPSTKTQAYAALETARELVDMYDPPSNP